MTFARYTKDARSARRVSIGHGTARPGRQRSPQIGQRLAALVAIPRSFIARSTVNQLATPHPVRSAAVRAAPKSP